MPYEHLAMSKNDSYYDREYRENGIWADQSHVVSRAKARKGQN